MPQIPTVLCGAQTKIWDCRLGSCVGNYRKRGKNQKLWQPPKIALCTSQTQEEIWRGLRRQRTGIGLRHGMLYGVLEVLSKPASPKLHCKISPCPYQGLISRWWRKKGEINWSYHNKSPVIEVYVCVDNFDTPGGSMNGYIISIVIYENQRTGQLNGIIF